MRLVTSHSRALRYYILSWDHVLNGYWRTCMVWTFCIINIYYTHRIVTNIIDTAQTAPIVELKILVIDPELTSKCHCWSTCNCAGALGTSCQVVRSFPTEDIPQLESDPAVLKQYTWFNNPEHWGNTWDTRRHNVCGVAYLRRTRILW